MGPLAGFRVVELAGQGPAPFCAMLLADMGAELLRLDRPGGAPADAAPDATEVLNRGRRSLSLDLKHPEGVALALDLAAQADALIEGFRPGVMERLGLGPEPCLARNPRLVYGRMTGWGQDGPLAQAPGHDINYLALSGVLHAIGPRDGPPVPPLNLIGDFGGGGLLLAFGLVCALLEAQRSGAGQVVDAAMVDGAALLASWVYGGLAAGTWRDQRESNQVDGGTPFYGVFETADGKFVSLAPLEPKFYAALGTALGISLPPQSDRSQWPALRSRIAAAIRTRTRDEWCAALEGSDVCFAPVLSLTEAPGHAHNRARETFITLDGVIQPAPAPRFSRSRPAATAAGDPFERLRDWGITDQRCARLRQAGVL